MSHQQQRRGVFRTVLHGLYVHDALSIGFLGALSILAAIFSFRLDAWLPLIGGNILIIAFISTVALIDERNHNAFTDAVHRYYVAILIFVIFKELYVMMPAVHPALYDDLLIAADRWMCGVNPTQWLQQFSTPWLVEILQICYASFFVIMFATAVEFSVRRLGTAYEHFSSAIVLGFFLSYIGYFILPAVGPRFTLHDFLATDLELPGLWLTAFLRSSLNAGESIPMTADAMWHTQRDAFPSGHVEMTLLTMYYAWKFSARIRWWVTVLGSGLIVATVFLRYHYVIDVIGGGVFFLLTLWLLPKVDRWWDATHARLSSW
jgi:membrane-associated phospholipid phosphatase